MQNVLKIAVDAMGGDGSPKKVIDGIIHHYKKNNNTFYKIFGDQEKISKFISNNLNKDAFEIIHTNEIVEGTDTPLAAAKRGKNTSMWNTIASQTNGESDISLSAGNTGVLLVISKMILRSIENRQPLISTFITSTPSGRRPRSNGTSPCPHGTRRVS